MDIVRLIMGQIQLLDAELATLLDKLEKVKHEIAALKRDNGDKNRLNELKVEAELITEQIKAIRYRLEAKAALLEGFKILYSHKFLPPGEDHLKTLIAQEIMARGLDNQANQLAMHLFGKTFAQLEGLELMEFWRAFRERFKIDALLF